MSFHKVSLTVSVHIDLSLYHLLAVAHILDTEVTVIHLFNWLVLYAKSD